MLCPKCNQELPEGSAFCNHCGANLDIPPKPVQETPILPAVPTETSKKKPISKKTLMSVGAVLLAVILLIVVIPSKAQRNEKAIAEDMKGLVWRMKDPSSFQIHGNVYLTYNDKGWRGFFVEYSANNTYGGRVTETAFIWNGKYLGNLGNLDYPTIIDEVSQEEYIAMGTAMLTFTTWEENGRPKSKNVVAVKGKDVAKRANVKWVDTPY